MGDGVGFEKTGARFIPLVRFDRDMFSDQVPGLVVVLPRFLYLIRVGRRSRSMVAAEILRRASEVFEDRGPKDWT